ncbi:MULTISPECIES: hypothetical protein [unclassified Virgibacillus]|uniref:hypothetical protein n=1 Tax=unclassified Virgibacillus TaxID=2620237 RepID=UPI00090A4669|nr:MULTISPECIES: hypothetical protein [unclassified Virgibacillus]API92673.1 hypothetical protein BKP57_13185 [Virgibacillus sp. 6R]MBS7428166.1 hypothetical protein [Virgibacillus sp. 19R1-5]
MAVLQSAEAFKKSYAKMREIARETVGVRFNIEYYHFDDDSEPVISIDAEAESLALDYVDEHGLVISILTKESIISFSEKSYTTNRGSDNSVVFASKHDEAHCIIQFI